MRLNCSVQAKKAACGPPKPRGTPKRCALPSDMSHPNSFGLFNKHNDNKSVAQTTKVPFFLAFWIVASKLTIEPSISKIINCFIIK